ncbi:uncharacterized protein NFIA_001200 [Aspergillus fischeri NRRL 181]|uniref:CorA-like Mg2+ transporter protein n=1 Tax=Neosartorya fischeri (strain ATCC 1020 / DSM 3700 / CBS 544.65 / FGSC A1164 / JCM 1740 / NRRL 181 / WB 181) TaxID=331117 RepID=A1DJ84_NEOFI|nr:conserved hypothetical protein [Aspergillus fischeri NRRL 181]EAW16773.1 conserved hypothetical protein [Aspergillus fischeri NRRL 181]
MKALSRVKNLSTVGLTKGFASTISTAPDTHGNLLSSDEVLELAISEEIFTILKQRYRFAGVIDAWEYRASAGFETRHIEYDEATGEVKFITLIVSIRLSTSFASVFAINHEFNSKTTSILGLRTSPGDRDIIQKVQESYKDMIGQPLFVPTVLLEASLAANRRYVEKVRRELGTIERATGYHGWLEIPGTEALTLNNELSKMAHATKQQVSISLRRLSFLQCYLKSIQETHDQLGHTISSSFTQAARSINQYEQWLHNIVLLLAQREADLAYYERRAENQITVIHTLLFQKDGMLALSVARRSQEIAEGAKRDSSALKSLNILAFLFFPPTYIATLFALPHFAGAPLYTYWVTAISLTLSIFVPWFYWTFVQHREIPCDAIPNISKNKDMPFHGIMLEGREQHTYRFV